MMNENINEKLFVALCEFMIVTRKSVIRPLITSYRPSISSLQFNVLLMLAFWGPQSMSEIANNMALSKQQMTQIIKKMDEAGLIMRSSDPLDGRRIIVELSKKGQELTNDIQARFLTSLKSRFDKADDAQLKQILTSMKSLYTLLDTEE